MTVERIKKNEERLDRVCLSIKNLEEALDEFISNKKDLALLNKYFENKVEKQIKTRYNIY